MNDVKCRVFRSMIPAMLVACAVVLFVPVLEAQAEGLTASQYGTILNLSGKQRMLTQKMSKEIVLVSLDVDKAANLQRLDKTSQLFDVTLKGLKDGNPTLRLAATTNSEIRAQLDLVNGLWLEFHAEVQNILKAGEVTPEQLAFVAEKNLPLLKEMNRCVKMYEVDAGSGGLNTDPGLAVTINLAGKQRMLSQKMSKEYFLVAAGHDTQANKDHLKATCSLFDKTLTGLLDGDPSLKLSGTADPKIRKQLNGVNTLWKQFRPAIKQAADPATSEIPRDKVQLIAGGNPVLLERMNSAVKMFERLAAHIDDGIHAPTS